MITNYYVYADSGKILLVHQGERRQIIANMTAGVGILVELDTPRNVESAKHYHKDGEILDRPKTDIPSVARVGEPVIIQGVQAGVDIKVDKAVVATSDGTTLELDFALGGEYEVEINPPFPHQRSSQTIKVSEATP